MDEIKKNKESLCEIMVMFRYWNWVLILIEKGDVTWKLQSSPMRQPAAEYLMWRAVGAPALVLALAIQGVFRGFKDTKTPLYATGK